MKIHRIVFIALLSAAPLSGGTLTTGQVSGSVAAVTGIPLAGVTLTIAGPHLPGVRTTTSDDRGQFRFVLLPPGDDYVVEAALGGFQIVSHRSISISLGKETPVRIVMLPAASAEVIVTAAAPTVDVRSAASSTNITAEQIAVLPSGRDFQQFTLLAPQAMFDRDAMNPAVAGATHLENDYVIEGLSTRDPVKATSATNLTMNFVEEIQVTTSGLSAEFGRSTGGVIVVLTRSGGNDLRGDVAAHYEDADWGPFRVTSAYRGSQTHTAGHDKKDVALSLGGPIRRDRVWFFAASNPRRDVTPVRLTDAAYGIDREERIIADERVYAAKLTVSLTKAQSLVVSAFGNPQERSGWLPNNARWDPDTALRIDHSGSRNLALQHHASLGKQTIAEVNAGAHRQFIYTIPMTETGRTVPLQQDYTGFRHGGYKSEYSDVSSRNAAAVRAGRLAGSHDLAIGGEIERNRYDNRSMQVSYYFEGPRVVSPEIGRKDVLWQDTLDFRGYGTNDTTTAFIHDRWSVTGNVTLTAGLRWERETIGSVNGVTVGTGRASDGRVVRKPARTFTLADNWAPRLGLVWDPTRRGRGRLYASAGRFVAPVPLHLNLLEFSGWRYESRQFYSNRIHTPSNWWNPSGSPLDDRWIHFNTQIRNFNGYGFLTNTGPIPIADDTRLPFQDEFSLGAEYGFGAAWVAGLRFLQRDMKRVMDDHLLFDAGGTRVVDAIISNVGESDFSSGYRTPVRRYAAFELTLQRRLSRRWQMAASFVSARARGDYDGSYDYANFAASPNATYLGDYAGWQRNAYGRLRADRPYQFKMHGSYAFPFGLTVSEAFVYASGVPVSAHGARRLLSGIRGLYLLPRGSMGRTPDHWTLDLHADWRIPIPLPRKTSIAVIADVFNATNQNAALDVDEEYFWHGQPEYERWIAPSNRDAAGLPKFNPDLPPSQYYRTGTRFQTPRRVQLGVKLAF